jgi:HEAT repeat protein
VMSLLERVAEDVETTLDTKKQEKKITAETLRRFVQAITPALSDPDRYVRWTAARTLRYISPEYFDDEVVLALGRMLIDPNQRDPDLSAAAAATIEAIATAPYAPKAILFLRSAIADPTMDANNRIAAMKALVAIGVKAANEAAVNEAFPEVTSAVGSDDVSVRKEACLTLGQLGHPGSEEHYRAAINALKTALRDEDTDVRLNASEAILSITPPR